MSHWLDRTLAAATILATLTSAQLASATVTEPNGMTVPVDPGNGEVELYTFFTQRGEGINWQTDALATPDSFAPLCSFTATYVLNQAGSHFGLAWYNDTGTQPQASDLHVLVPANSAVGTTFTGVAISGDPAYMGGLVGFALVGGETHYTNPAYDTVCTTPFCNPAGPWITALMYASTVTPNSYYICFEDGSTNAFGWANDGDFNDDVYFVTGISCMGGGQPCDTGKPGVCAAGLTGCAGNCQEITPPAATETCNGVDDNCDGMVDNDAICPDDEICYQGTCVHSCQSGEFQCETGFVCSSAGYCIDMKCATVTCPAGQACVNGACKGPCDGITCPTTQVCRTGVCVDPCAGVTCPTGLVCAEGACVASCTCQPCATGTACNAMTGQCVAPACATMTCPAGDSCSAAGTCVDDCMGAVCPSGQTCTAGECVSGGVDGGATTTMDGGGGLTGPTGGDGGAFGPDATLGNVPEAGTSTGFGAGGNSSGCGCRSAGSTSFDFAALSGLLGVVGAAFLRRRSNVRRRGDLAP